jgi:peptide/nickel transport system substrate-binding protein
VSRVGLALALAAALPAPLARAADLPAYGGELRVALPLPPRQADPALAREVQDLFLSRALHATPLALGEGGRLGPGLLAAVPEPLPGGRVFQLTLREGLRFSDGTPLLAKDLVGSLARLLRPEVGSPHGWVAAAIQGAEEVMEGRAASPSGLQVLSERELLVTLAFPFPSWPAALAALPAAVVSPAGAGAGPFRRDPQGRLVANEHAWRGRPYADLLTLSAPDPRAVARGLEASALELSLRPEAAAGGLPSGPVTLAFAAVNGHRLGAGAPPVRQVLATLDRGDLVRRFVRAPAEPLAGLLPAGLLAAAPTGSPGAGGPSPARLALLVPGWLADARAVGERLQVRLFDAGLRPVLEPLDQARYGARLAAGDYDVALVVVPLLTDSTALAAGQVAGAVGGPRAARRAEQALEAAADGDQAAAGEALRAELDLWPLFTSSVRMRAAAGVGGAAPGRDGALDPGDLWRAPVGPP